MFSKFYDEESAKLALDAEITKSISTVAAAGDAACQHMHALDADALMVQVTGENRKVWRVGPSTKDGPVEAELVFRIQGILAKKNLVPGDLSRIDPAKVGNLSQQVTVVGAGSQLFQVSLANMKHFHALFKRHFPGSTVTNLAGAENGVLGLNASNRYFTFTQDEPSAIHVAFAHGVDPIGQLQAFVGPNLVHSTENQVAYYKTGIDLDTSKTVYDRAFPGTFRIGDIVEIQASIVAFQGRDKTVVRLRCHLSALTLLDATFSKAAENAQELQVKQSIPRAVSLKRKVGYGETEAKDMPNKKSHPIAPAASVTNASATSETGTGNAPM
ncbi:hypothetical protein B0H11DRAFT_2236179 [Mycena galericulata]|nr:hypothetical protein B0H11DRAFT_2236179 [Mycena galericulata]